TQTPGFKKPYYSIRSISGFPASSHQTKRSSANTVAWQQQFVNRATPFLASTTTQPATTPWATHHQNMQAASSPRHVIVLCAPRSLNLRVSSEAALRHLLPTWTWQASS